MPDFRKRRPVTTRQEPPADEPDNVLIDLADDRRPDAARRAAPTTSGFPEPAGRS